mgnify:CR=1 FL=1
MDTREIMVTNRIAISRSHIDVRIRDRKRWVLRSELLRVHVNLPLCVNKYANTIKIKQTGINTGKYR